MALRAVATEFDEAKTRSDTSAPAVVRLTLIDFRSYARAEFAIVPRPVVLTGPNGAGKTNLLEAVSFLAPGRGLRRAKLTEIDRRGGAGPWALSIRLASAEGEVQIGTGRDAASETGERRILRFDGVAAKSQAELAQRASLVWLTPQMDRLFTEGTSARRRFLDRLVSGFDPEHPARLSAHERAMRERLRLLRHGGADASWLATLEDQMATQGVAIAAARGQAVGQLAHACAAGTGPFPRAGLAMDCAVDALLARMPALAAEEELRRSLGERRRLDGESGVTSVGPHRSDLAVYHLGNAMPAASCSTGEQKALLIAILLAQARLLTGRRGHAPLMLLDEVAAHLDAERRAALFAELLGLKTQAWLTGTDASLFAALRGQGGRRALGE